MRPTGRDPPAEAGARPGAGRLLLAPGPAALAAVTVVHGTARLCECAPTLSSAALFALGAARFAPRTRLERTTFCLVADHGPRRGHSAVTNAQPAPPAFQRSSTYSGTAPRVRAAAAAKWGPSTLGGGREDSQRRAHKVNTRRARAPNARHAARCHAGGLRPALAHLGDGSARCCAHPTAVCLRPASHWRCKEAPGACAWHVSKPREATRRWKERWRWGLTRRSSPRRWLAAQRTTACS